MDEWTTGLMAAVEVFMSVSVLAFISVIIYLNNRVTKNQESHQNAVNIMEEYRDLNWLDNNSNLQTSDIVNILLSYSSKYDIIINCGATELPYKTTIDGGGVINPIWYGTSNIRQVSDVTYGTEITTIKNEATGEAVKMTQVELYDLLGQVDRQWNCQLKITKSGNIGAIIFS